MDEIIKVGMADWRTSLHPGTLMTLGLGSCVGVCLYENKKKMIGLAHVMLPDSAQVRSNTNRAKFADTGIADMIQEMVKIGADIRYITAKIAGGAQMFAYSSNSDILRVGVRNAESTRDVLKNYKIPIIADDTGGSFGRTIEFSSTDGTLMVKTIGHGIHFL